MNSWEKASASCAAQAETKRPGTAATSAISASGIFGMLFSHFPWSTRNHPGKLGVSDSAQMYLSGSLLSSRTMLYPAAPPRANWAVVAWTQTLRSAALSLHQALRAHIGPVLLDVLQAAGPGIGVMRDAPAIRHRLRRRPQAVLTLMVHQHPVRRVRVFEWIRHTDPRLDR